MVFASVECILYNILTARVKVLQLRHKKSSFGFFRHFGYVFGCYLALWRNVCQMCSNFHAYLQNIYIMLYIKIEFHIYLCIGICTIPIQENLFLFLQNYRTKIFQFPIGCFAPFCYIFAISKGSK